MQLRAPVDQERTGALDVVLRNQSPRTVALSLRYLPDDGSPSIALTPQRGPTEALVSFAARHHRPLVAPHQVTRLLLRFRVSETSVASAANGRLLIFPKRVRRGKVGPTGPPLVIAVRGRLAPIPRVRVLPASATIQLTRWLSFLGDTSGNHAHVGIVGEGAQAALKNPSAFDGAAVLRSDGGHSAEVTWKMEPDKDRTSHFAVIIVHGGPPPGTYTGVLPLGLSSGDPKITLTLHSRDALWLAVLVVLIGAGLGGMLPLLAGRAIRKGRLRADLQGVLETYSEARGDRTQDPDSYSIDGALGPDKRPWTEKEWMPIPQLFGAAGLFSSIWWARDDNDLDLATAWSESLIGKVRGWLLVEPEAHCLRETLDKDVAPLLDQDWRKSGTCTDTRRLLLEAREEPASDEATNELAMRIQRQREWHESVAEAWDTVAAMTTDEALSHPEFAIDLLAIANPEKPELERTRPEQIDLQLALENLQHELEATSAEGAANIDAQDVAPAESMLVRARTGIAHTLTLGPKATSRVKALSKQTHRLPRPKLLPSVRLLRETDRQEILLTALLVVAAVVGYMVPLYTSTWGSVTDYLTALLAGFGSQTVVRWALLPAFQSRRPKKPPGAAAKSEPVAS